MMVASNYQPYKPPKNQIYYQQTAQQRKYSSNLILVLPNLFGIKVMMVKRFI